MVDSVGQQTRLPGGSPPSLRKKFTRAVLLAAVLPALLLSAVDLVVGYRTAEKTLRDRAEAAAVLSAAAVDGFLQAHLSGTALLADLDSPEAEPWDTRLADLRRRYPAFHSALVTDRDGEVVARVPALSSRDLEFGVKDRDYFLEPKATGQPAISNAFIGRRSSGDHLVAVSAPLVAGDDFQGVVEASVPVEAFTALRTTLIQRRGMGTLILDRAHRVVHATEGLPYQFLQQVDPSDFTAPLGTGQRASNAVRLRNAMADGRGAWISQAPLQSGWTLVIFAPDNGIVAGVGQRALGTLVVMVLIATGVWLAYAWQMRRFNHALRKLITALNRLVVQDYPDRHTPGTLPVEFQPLGTAIGELAGKLKDTSVGLEKALDQQLVLAMSLQQTLDEREQEIQSRTAQLRQAVAELDRLNQTDALTGALNRRGLQHRLANWLDVAGNLHTPLALVAVDVDWFKSYNDRYGHAAGDKALHAVAAAGMEMLGSREGAFARLGGEEFLLVLATADVDLARAVACAVLARVRQLGMPHEDSPLAMVTVSVGLAMGGVGAEYAALSLAADAALYRAKHAGRNRVETDA